MSLARVHNFSITLDGFATGEGQSKEDPFGHAGERLHEWMSATRLWDAGASGGVDDAFVQQHDPGIGAEIMGVGKFGHGGTGEGLPGGGHVLAQRSHPCDLHPYRRLTEPPAHHETADGSAQMKE